MTINALQFPTLAEAFQHYDADPKAVDVLSIHRVPGYVVTLAKGEAEKLDAAGVSFAYLYDREIDGSFRTVSVPVN